MKSEPFLTYVCPRNWIPRMCSKSMYAIARNSTLSYLSATCGMRHLRNASHTYTTWFIWYEVLVCDVCPVEPGRRAPADWGRETAGQEGGEHGSRAHGYWWPCDKKPDEEEESDFLLLLSRLRTLGVSNDAELFHRGGWTLVIQPSQC